MDVCCIFIELSVISTVLKFLFLDSTVLDCIMIITFLSSFCVDESHKVG